MPEYLIEFYVPAGSASDVGAASVRKAAEVVASHGEAARYRRSMYVAADETCFVLIDAETTTIAQEVARLAGVPASRISEVAAEPADSDHVDIGTAIHGLRLGNQ
jgi:Protein of unknown function (DUF4242)